MQLVSSILSMIVRRCLNAFKAGYYLPFYFQAVKGVSATKSGIDFIALAIPEVIAILIAGAIANKTGHYV